MTRSILSLILSGCLLPAVAWAGENNRILWQIGRQDRSAAEFALAPNRYTEYLNQDFGWEDRFYLVGYSTPEKDFPYVLPGPADAWSGSDALAGSRSCYQNVYFDVRKKGKGDWCLYLDFLDTHAERPPLLKVSLNGVTFKEALPKGGGDASLSGDYGKAQPRTWAIPIPASLIREGHNSLCLYSLEGSWVIFDDLRLEGPSAARLSPPAKGAYVGAVRPGERLTINGEAQPLLVEAHHLEGRPLLTVELDGKPIYSRRLEAGSYELEAPMPPVNHLRKWKSTYAIRVDGRTVRRGTVERTPCEAATQADYIDTRMGTAHSRWMLSPGPWMPFSMVKLGPDNQNTGWQGGYDTAIESIGTFSHIHEWTMSGLGTFPVTGPLKTQVGDQSELKGGWKEGYRSRFDKSTEVGQVGYYAVRLSDYDILAELTATDRCSFQRYTYPTGERGRVLIDLQIPAEYSYEIESCRLEQTSPRTIKGYCRQNTPRVWSDDADQYYTLYFTIEFDRDMDTFTGWTDKGSWTGPVFEADYPADAGCYAEFAPTSDNVLQMRIGLSLVDGAGADANLREEIAVPYGWDFEAVRSHQKDVWNDILSRVQVTSDDRLELKRFYTNLYRSYCRNTFSDVDGRWRDPLDQVRCLGEGDARALGCDAFWNTFWNLNQVWNLLTPEWSSRWVRSQLALYESTGWLGKGPAGMKLIPVMVAEHEIPLMVGAWQMGIRDYDPETLFQAVVKMQTTPASSVGRGFAGNRDLTAYLTHHYVPCDQGRFSNTMEYSFDDWTVSQLALSLGKEEAYRTFAERGTWWKNAVNPEDGYCHLRNAAGEWMPDFDPFRSGANEQYVEGNAWQLTFFVPQDVEGLADRIGRKRFIERLEWGFNESYPLRFNAPNEQYWAFPVTHGNQQSMHFAYLFNHVGEAWRTQKWSRAILDRYYGYASSNCWLGDEDQGQMSAWLVMSAIGLFQMDGGCSVEPFYDLTSPVFPCTIIDLGGRYGRGERFVIRAHDVSRTHRYIQSARLNGEPWNSCRLPASSVLEGGELELWMGPEPNPAWGNQSFDTQSSSSTDSAWDSN